ncbi:MAG: hypothetical protein Crog3KO_09880 [Crocinitomicaceae bacterium]
MKTILIAIAALCAFSLSAQTSNFKQDIGLRIGTLDAERFQLDYRFHKNEKWSYTLTGYFGNKNNYYSNFGFVIPDSTFEIESSQFRRNSFGATFGIQRQLNFMKHDYYYAGASLGGGSVSYSSHYRRTTYAASEDSIYSGPFPQLGEELESESQTYVNNAFNINTRIYIGADVPIIDRLYLNFELGLIAELEINNVQQFSYISIPGYFSGGIRYRFGKVE